MANTPELLIGRQAECLCGTLRPSEKLQGDGFFTYRGEGSQIATETCECGFHKLAHAPGTTCKCKNFVARGPMEFDSWYCGCRGWD